MKNKKIVFFSNFLSPYQLEFLNELSRYVTTKAVFNEKKIFNTNWKILNNENYFNISSLKKKNRKLFYKNLIKNFNPNVILLGGYRLKDFFLITKILFKKKIKIYFFLEKPKNNYYIGLVLKKIYLYFLLKLFNVRGIFAVGKDAKKYYESLCKNVFNLPYSINGQKYKQVQLPKKLKKIKFVFIGQLIKRKNINLLLNAFKILNQTGYENKLKLTIIGKGAEIDHVKQLSKKYSNLEHFGFLNQVKLRKILHKQHVLILPSRIEGWGVVINQAMAFGLTLIINKKMEIYKDFFRDNINGVSINNSVKSLSEKMIYLINNNNKIREMGNNNYKYFFNSKLEVKNSVKYFISKI